MTINGSRGVFLHVVPGVAFTSASFSFVGVNYFVYHTILGPGNVYFFVVYLHFFPFGLGKDIIIDKYWYMANLLSY